MLDEHDGAADHSLDDVIALGDALSRLEVLERQAGILDVPDEPVPARVGAYRLTSKLGRGGMGVVYLAERAMVSSISVSRSS